MPEPKAKPEKEKKEPAPKPTAAEYEQRITEVHSYLVGRKSRGFILKSAAEKWKIGERQADELIALATEQVRQSAAYDREVELGLALDTLRAVIGKAASMQDFQRVIAAQREINLLLGQYAPTKTELKIDGLDIRTLERLAAAATGAGKNIAELLALLTRQLEEMNKSDDKRGTD